MKRILFICLMVIMPLLVNAQTEYKNRFYVGYLNMSLHSPYVDLEVDNGNGVMMGLAFKKHLNPNEQYLIFVSYGIECHYAYFDNDDFNDFIVNYLYASIPINIGIDFKIPETKMVISPFVGFNIKGNIIGDGKYYDHEGVFGPPGNHNFHLFSGHKDSDYLEDCNRIQFGLNLGLDFSFGKYNLGYRFTNDFTKLDKDTELKTNMHVITLGVNF